MRREQYVLKNEHLFIRMRDKYNFRIIPVRSEDADTFTERVLQYWFPKRVPKDLYLVQCTKQSLYAAIDDIYRRYLHWQEEDVNPDRRLAIKMKKEEAEKWIESFMRRIDGKFMYQSDDEGDREYYLKAGGKMFLKHDGDY